MRDIVYLSLITLLVFAITFPEAIGRWQARRDIAYEFAWEETVP
jgi:hypothetical protein